MDLWFYELRLELTSELVHVKNVNVIEIGLTVTRKRGNAQRDGRPPIL